jgi:DNA repair exonuclease SbcCD ATPase subunit
MFADDTMTRDELRSKLNSLEETRETARRELTALASWNESLEAFERDKDKLLKSYATLAPEALAALDPDERRTVYSMLGICVEALPDKSLRVRGAFGEENLVWEKERTSTR